MSVTVEEKSLQLALVKAAGQLGTTQDAISYKIVGKSSGFLGMFGKKVSIEAWKKERGSSLRGASAKSRSSRGSYNDSPKRVLSDDEIDELKNSLHEFCVGICSQMVGEKVEVLAELDGDRLVLDIRNDDLAAQMGKNGRLAEALEHILRKKPRHIRQELPFRVFIDVNGQRRSRENELVDMAQDLSNKVFENKRPIVLNYRSSYDRKIIHMALDKDDRVYTKSIGTGPNRKLMILPSKDEAAGLS